MKFCGNCGAKMEDNVKFCPGCGASTEIQSEQSAQQPSQQSTPAPEYNQESKANSNNFGAKFQNLNNTADTTAQFDQDDITNNKTMAILAYFGPLVLIPIFAAKGSKFARFHSNQGLLLLLACVAWGIVYAILNAILLAISWRLFFISSIIGFLSVVFLILCIIGIVNAVNGRAKELPVIGKFKLLK